MNRNRFTSILWVFAIFTLIGSNSLPDGQSFSQAAPVALTETWTKTWGGGGNDAVHSAAIDPSGNFYLIGDFAGTVDFNPDPVLTENHTSTNGTIDAFVSKFNANGVFQWAKTWGGGIILPGGPVGRDVANGVAIDVDGNVYVSGLYQYTVDFDPDPITSATYTSNATVGNSSANNIFVSKFTPDGSFQWVRTWGPSDGGAESYSLAYDGSGSIYVVGDFSGKTAVNFNPWGTGDWHTNHQPDHAGDPVFFDSYISKFSTNGTFQWAKTWGGEGYDDGPGVAVDGFGNVYVAGMYGSLNINFDPAGGAGGTGHPANDSGHVVDAFLSKFSSSGTFQWVKTWGCAGADDVAEIITFDGANNIYVGGRFASTNCDFNPGAAVELHSSNGNLNAYASKFDPAGTFQWARTWGGSGWDSDCGIGVDALDNIYVTGFFVNQVNFDPAGSRVITSNGGRDAFINKLSGNGETLWTYTWGGSEDDFAWHLTFDGSDTFYAVGSFSTVVDFDPGSGTDNHTSNGLTDAFMTKFPSKTLPDSIYLPMAAR